MTSSIRPPGGPGATPDPDSLASEGQTAAADFAKAVDQAAAATDSAAATDVAAAAARDAGAAVGVGAGGEAAAFVAHALEGELARSLSLDARRELASFLTETLAEDPTLQALLALQRGE